MSKNWHVVALGEVCETGAGGTPLKSHKEYYHKGTIPWLLSGEVSQGEIYSAKNFITKSGLDNSSAKLFPPNTVLVAMYGATAGQVGILRFEASTNQAVCGILPNEKTVPEYLYYCFLSKKDELVAQAVGGAQPNISQIKIRNTRIPLPTIKEQKHIVSILDETFAAIDKAKQNAEKNLQNAKELFESYSNKCFSGLQGNLRKLEEIVHPECNLSYGVVRPGEGYDNGLPIVRPTDLTQKFIGLDTLKRINPINAVAYNRTVLKGDELLLCVRGTTGTIGVANPELKGSNVTRGIVPIYFKSEEVDRDFAYYQFISPLVQKQIKSKTYGAALMQINIGDLRKINFIDCSMKAQKEIVQILSGIETKTKQLTLIYKQELAKLEELKKTILLKAFTGELTTKRITELV